MISFNTEYVKNLRENGVPLIGKSELIIDASSVIAVSGFRWNIHNCKGLTEVTIDWSVDGETWHTVIGTPEFMRHKYHLLPSDIVCLNSSYFD
jgi:hypothetical protein